MSFFLCLPLALLSLTAHPTLAAVSDCPLDLSWSNFTSAASACTSPDEMAKCCRYINVFIVIAVARYANTTGQLGVATAISGTCIDSISDTLISNGIPQKSMAFCGLGAKILVNYECRGRKTVLEMLQSPSFSDVTNSCKTPHLPDFSCKKCLNSGMLYLHQLIGADDNITLSTCRDAMFVALANHHDQLFDIEIARCLFGVHMFGIYPENVPGAPPLPSPEASPSTVLASPPAHQLLGLTSSKQHHHPYQLTMIQGIGVGVTSTAVFLLVILIILIRKKSRQLKSSACPTETSSGMLPPPARRSQEGPPLLFKRFSYKETKKATSGFSMVIGRGGFGTVYKAQFSDGSVAAVKRMDQVSQQGEDDFCREMDLLGRLHHRHLVSLKGFCANKRERFLVYEYMANGSLKDHLHAQGRSALSWDTRMRIAIDVANALEYLHFYCDPPLCHRDIKSSNILLDENLVAKVADFGLAHASRSGSISFEPVNTDIRGTPGYMDPEYVVTRELTEKSDVYSYGVLLLELVTGRRAVQDNKNLVEWSRQFMGTDSRLPELVDPLIANSFDLEQLQVIVGIIQWCTQGEGRARPSIKQVLRMLYEGLDPVHHELAKTIGDNSDDDIYDVLGITKGKSRHSMTIPSSGDARCLMSSSSTSRSYCSRSYLLESGSPQSPTSSSYV